MAITVDFERFLTDLRALSAFGRGEAGIDRGALSATDMAARRWLLGRMAEAGLETQIDGAGNVFGRTPGHRRHVLIGSHSDTVPRGGWLDGAMGVVMGLEIARAAAEQGLAGDCGVEVVSFNDEEGRFAVCLGSKIFCGMAGPADFDAISDGAGVSFARARVEAGVDALPIARVDPARHVAFVEAHIEQGPVLEASGEKIGVVTAIVGARRLAFSFDGQADHAGTTPVALRRDAGAAAVRFCADFIGLCQETYADSAVFNVGKLELSPGVSNVVARRAEIVLEFRSQSSAVLDAIDSRFDDLGEQAASAYRAEFKRGAVVRLEPTELDADVQRVIAAGARRFGHAPRAMPSGAAHDAMILARQIPTGMIFVPSIGGRSHTPVEDSSVEDLAIGLDVTAATVFDLIAAHGGVS